MRRKLRSTKGESIAEVLVACLIMALGTLMLAGMITTAKKLILRSDGRFREHYKLVKQIESGEFTNGVEQKDGSLEVGAIEIQIEGSSAPIVSITPSPVPVKKIVAGEDGKKEVYCYQ